MSTYESSYETPREARGTGDRPLSGWHPVSIGHLVMGVAFVGLFAVWTLHQADVVDIPPHGWLLGLPWVLAGAIGLIATVLRHRGGASGRMQGWIGSNDSPDSPA